ncbi:TIGR04290 family methyltransferase [Telmatospirillum sp. J64-1]|uniref:TIGR04290 family methyltransferase n=1 Tax=Telmatospirillum sp. J64-1 TaxID=2502183 RepID=UPI0021083730|nr:TIGR04290 family methyltransferase [Telmatospirillum sp. J64-1]
MKDVDDIQELGPWFHNLHLPDGRQTAPDHHFGDFPAFKWAQIADHIPADLSGWRALDIGCNAGFYSFQLAARGAEVTGIDVNDHYLRQARWAAKQFDVEDRVRFENRQVYQLGSEGESYDLVLFMGVFYHLRYPLLVLDILRTLAPRLMVFQTLTLPEDQVAPNVQEDVDFQSRDRLREPGWPRMAFIEHSFSKDITNWWIPNPAAIEGMLRAAGFRITGQPGHEIYLCESAEPSCWWDRTEFLAATGRT